MSLRQTLIGVVHRALPGGIGRYEIECDDSRRVPFVIDGSSDLARQVDPAALVGECCELAGHMRTYLFVVESVDVLP